MASARGRVIRRSLFMETHALVLRRVDPDRRMARFYFLRVERDLFGTVRLVRNWGRIEAGKALEAMARAKRDL